MEYEFASPTGRVNKVRVLPDAVCVEDELGKYNYFHVDSIGGLINALRNAHIYIKDKQ